MEETVESRFVAVASKHDGYAAVSFEVVEDERQEVSPRPTRQVPYGRLYSDAEAVAEAVGRTASMNTATRCCCLWLERSYGMVCAIFGAVLSGHAYVPMDVEAPNARLSDMLEDCRPSCVLTLERHRERFKDRDAFRSTPVVEIEDAIRRHRSSSSSSSRPSSSRACHQNKATSFSWWSRRDATRASTRPLYVFFTSGTTGKPKGVAVPHGGLVNRVSWLQSRYGLRPGADVVLQRAFYGFGVSEWEIFWPLLHGATLGLARPGAYAKDSEYVLAACRRLGATTLCVVPSQLEALLDMGDALNLSAPSISLVLSAGEALSWSLAEASLTSKVLPSLTRVVNLYGPTEADMTYFEIDRAGLESLKSHYVTEKNMPYVPAGFEIAESTVALRNQTPHGVGEIVFYGRGVALGYAPAALYGDPNYSGGGFFDDPVLGRGYATGDLGRLDAQTGCLHFLGRADRQVKIRGVRLELGEVEAALGAAGATSASALVIGAGASAFLVAFYKHGPADLKARLSSLLPAHAIPASLVQLDTFPLTANGKLDSRKLARDFLEADGRRGDNTTTADGRTPANVFNDPLEAELADIWSQLLGRPPPSSDATFESFGATSLAAGRCVASLRKRLGARVPVTALFTHNTIAKLALYLRDNNLVSDDLLSSSSRRREPGGEKISTTTTTTESRTVASSRYRAAAPGALLANVLAFYLQSFVDFEAGLPAVAEFSLVFACYTQYALVPATALAAGAFVAVVALGVLLAASVKWLVLGRSTPGSVALFSPQYFAWLLATNVFQSAQVVVRELAAGTPAVVWFYRLFGAAIGPRADLDCFLYDPDMAVLKQDVSAGHDAVLTGHRVFDGRLHLAAYHLGENAALGPRAFVASGARLDPDASLGSMATLDDAGLRAGSLWSRRRDRYAVDDTPTDLRRYRNGDASSGRRDAAAVDPRGAKFSSVSEPRQHCSTDNSGVREHPKRRRTEPRFVARQQWLRLVLGVPLMAAVRMLPQGLAVAASVKVFGRDRASAVDVLDAPVLVVLAVAWVFSLVASQATLALVVFLKRAAFPLLDLVFAFLDAVSALLCSRSRVFDVAAASMSAHSVEFRHWFATRLVSTVHFEAVLAVWINTEVLSCIFRALGATVGRKVQMDAFHAVDHAAVVVGDDVVFGHGVTIETSELVEDSENDDDDDASLRRPARGRRSGPYEAVDVDDAYSASTGGATKTNGHCTRVAGILPFSAAPIKPSVASAQRRNRRTAHRNGERQPLSGGSSSATGSSSPALSRHCRRRLVRRRRPCVIEAEAQVLDHCHLEGGVKVRDRALLGSTTLVPSDYTVAEGSTSMGNVDGAPVVLRKDAGPNGRPKTPDELVARRRHDSCLAWTGFNAWNITCALVLESLQMSVWLAAASAAYRVCDDSWTLYLLAFPAFDFILQSAETLVVLAIKWLLVGTYQAGDFPFYGLYHYKWACMLLLHRSTKPFFDKIRGTCFLNAVYRAFGAAVGSDCCLLTSTVEFDLCDFDARAAVGFHAVIQPHTVENLVIKLGPFSMGHGAALAHLAAIMPDTALEPRALLLENSLLPKGCLVQAGTVWAGLPAAEVDFDLAHIHAPADDLTETRPALVSRAGLVLPTRSLPSSEKKDQSNATTPPKNLVLV